MSEERKESFVEYMKQIEESRDSIVRDVLNSMGTILKETANGAYEHAQHIMDRGLMNQVDERNKEFKKGVYETATEVIAGAVGDRIAEKVIEEIYNKFPEMKEMKE